MGWFRLPEDEKLQDFELALNLATNGTLSSSRSPMNTSSMIFKKPFNTSLAQERPGLYY